MQRRRVGQATGWTGWGAVVAAVVWLAAPVAMGAPVGFTGSLTIDFSASGGGTLVIPGSGTANVSGPAGALTQLTIPAGAFAGSGSIPVSGEAGAAVLKGAAIANGSMVFSAGGVCDAGHAPTSIGFPGVACSPGGLAGFGAINGLMLTLANDFCVPGGFSVAVPNIGAGSSAATLQNCAFLFDGLLAYGAGFGTAAVSVPPLSMEAPGGTIMTAPGAFSAGSQVAGTVSLVSPIRVISGPFPPFSGAGAGIARLQVNLATGSTTTTLPSGSVDVGVTGKKLIIIDKLTAAEKAKVVYVAKDTTPTKGAGTDAALISAAFDYEIPVLGAAGSVAMPQGMGWLVNKDTVAKYVNKAAPTGGAAKVSVIKPGKLLKVVAKDLGDAGTKIDVYQGGAATTPVDAATRYTVTNGGTTVRHCGTFTGCVRKLIGGDTGAKVVCKNAVADPICGGVGATTTSTTMSGSTTTTTTLDLVCCGGLVSAGTPYCAMNTTAACMAAGGTIGAPGTVCEESGDACVPSGGTTTTTTTISGTTTTSTTIDAVCCDGLAIGSISFCGGGTSAAECVAAGGSVGAPGTVCDDFGSGACVPAPGGTGCCAVPGGSCSNLAGAGCSLVGGVDSPGTCTPTGCQ